MKYMPDFCSRLKAAMEVSGTSTTELAKRSGFSLSNISHFTTGQREPTRQSLARLLDCLPEVDARWLITGKVKP